MFDTVLVANRGEIAVRVIRTLRRLGIRSVAVYSDADAGARHVLEADTRCGWGRRRHARATSNRQSHRCCGPHRSRRRSTRVTDFSPRTPHFAAACDRAGVVFLGPPARAIEVMGDKIAAKNAVVEFDVPVVPGVARPGLTDDELVAAADEVGYPVLIKPSAGGGGKGMRLVEDPARLREALVSARREAGLRVRRRHAVPGAICVAAQAYRGAGARRHARQRGASRRARVQPATAPSEGHRGGARRRCWMPQTRARIGAAACNTARSVDYVGAGTVEFIVSADRPDEFFFMEMNTRLQVEHPVTEAVTGLDLVEWQLRVAAGEKLAFAQDDIELRGHAIEARVYAEDPARGFLPTGGRVLRVVEPSGAGVRVDSSLLAGTVVGSDYDPMLSKVIAHGDRPRAGAGASGRGVGADRCAGGADQHRVSAVLARRRAGARR